MKGIRFLLVVLMPMFLPACVTQREMEPKSTSSTVVDPNVKVTLLMTVTLRNDNHPSYQPRLWRVDAEKPDGKGDYERIVYWMDTDGAVVSEEKTDYQVRLVMDPTVHVIRNMMAKSGTFFITEGYFNIPLHMDVNITNPGVYYVGHIEAVVRERKEGEFRAGAMMPLINQCVVGASSGTIEVAVEDRFESDIGAFKDRFPALRNVQIQKAILPQWDRVKAQQWWETH